jgi:hypothetical protein
VGDAELVDMAVEGIGDASSVRPLDPEGPRVDEARTAACRADARRGGGQVSAIRISATSGRRRAGTGRTPPARSRPLGTFAIDSGLNTQLEQLKGQLAAAALPPDHTG